MKAVINGVVALRNRVSKECAVVFDDKIRALASPADISGCEIIDAQGAYVFPGLIDMHIHGYLGEDASDGSAEGLRNMAIGIAKNGVTSWLPTTMTVSYDDLRAAFAAIREVMAQSQKDAFNGAEILGVNAEGPFINPQKKGAQSGEHVKPCDVEFLSEYADIIRVFTIAPEMKGNMEAIKKMRAAHPNMLISMGHTAATYDKARRAVDVGVRHVTHLFNAQTPLMHRDPGVVGCALMDKRISTELIADMFHVNKALFKLVAKLKGEKLILITDCTRAGGMADGEYTLGGQPIYVNGIECRLADGTIAGSVLKLNNAIKNMNANLSRLPLNKVVNMASLNPAKAIKADARKGSIDIGKDADICIMSAGFDVLETISRGRTIYKA